MKSELYVMAIKAIGPDNGELLVKIITEEKAEEDWEARWQAVMKLDPIKCSELLVNLAANDENVNIRLAAARKLQEAIPKQTK